MATKIAAPNLPRFRDIKNRVSDLYANCGDAIRSKKTVWATALIFTEMEWLLAEIKRLAGGGKQLSDPERYKRIAGFVRRVCREQGEAIKNGEIIKIGADIFGAMRYLVRGLEAIIVDLVDDDVAETIGSERLPDEHSSRINLDLTEGIADADEEDEDEEPARQTTAVKVDISDFDGDRWTEKLRSAPRAPVDLRQPEKPSVAKSNFVGLSGKTDDSDLPGGDAPAG